MKHIQSFEGFLNESRYSIYKKEIEWKQHPNKSGSYIANLGKSELEILSTGYGNWQLKVDGKPVSPSETAKEKSAKDNHTNVFNWHNDTVGTLKHTAQEMFEGLMTEGIEGAREEDKELIAKVKAMKDYQSSDLRGVYIKDGHINFIMRSGYSDKAADVIWDATKKVGLSQNDFSIHSTNIENQTNFKDYQRI